jgi:hypothetical protein
MFRSLLASVIGLSCLLGSIPIAIAEEPVKHPLGYVPEQVDFVLTLERPRLLVEKAVALLSQNELKGFSGVRNYLDSTNYRRFQRLLTYVEKELGYRWPEILDRIAGRGVVLAGRYAREKPPLLLVMQGDDAALAKKYVDLTLKLVEQEFVRQEKPFLPGRRKHRDVEILSIGDDVHVAVVDATILVSNHAKAMEIALDTSRGREQASFLGSQQEKDARKQLLGRPVMWGWLNLVPPRENKEFREAIQTKGPQPALHVLFGHLVDAVARAPALVASLHQEGDAWQLAVNAAVERREASIAAQPHLPPPRSAGLPALLKPPGTLYSATARHDYRIFWTRRAELYTEKQLRDLEQFDKNSKQVLLGSSFSELLSYVGVNQRYVVSQQRQTNYEVKPQNRIPAFAVVLELDQAEEFHKAIEPRLRTLGLLATTQVKMKLAEEKVGEHKLVGYRFEEDTRNKAIQGGVLFNFSPCFARVGNQMIFSSTLELGRDLVPLVGNAKTINGSQSLISQEVFHWAGLSDFFDTVKDNLVGQNILESGNTPEEAKREVELFLKMLSKLGTIEVVQRSLENQLAYEIRFGPAQ